MIAKTVSLRPTTDSAVWDDLVHSFHGGLPFHEWAWLDFQEQVLGGVFKRLLVYLDDRPVGILPVPVRSPDRWRKLPVPFPMLGPLVPASLWQETFEAFRRYQLRSGPVTAQLDLGPLIMQEARGAVAAAGCRAHEDATVVVDLSHGSVDELHAAFSSMRRRAIRRAARDGASVRVAEPGEMTRLLPQLLSEAYGAHDVASPYPADIGALLEDWSRDRDDIAVFTGLLEGEPAGMQVVLGSGPTALYWMGASWRRFRGVDVSALLYQRIMEWSIEQGCERIDLCGRVDEGVLKYKLSFGGVERPYLSVESSPMPTGLLEVARSLNGAVSRARSMAGTASAMRRWSWGSRPR